MHPIEALGILTRGTGFPAEAVGQSGHEDGSLIQVDDVSGVVAPQGDFRGAHQAGVGTFQGVDVGLLAPGIESDSFGDFIPGDVRCDGEGEAVLAKDVQGVAGEGQFQQDRLILKKVELTARDFRTGLEINQIERFGQFGMVFGAEVEG
jgi:hypothetical protein